MEPTYDAIKDCVAKTTVNGATIEVRWQDPATGRDIGTSTATMAPDASAGAALRDAAHRGILREVVWAVTSTISKLVGGAAGRVVNDVAHTAGSEVQRRTSNAVAYTDGSRRRAIVEAFRAVQDRFAWSEARGGFVAK